MKNVLFIFFLLPLFLVGQDAPPATLYEVINIQVKAGQDEAFQAAVKSHNEMYHPEGSHFAQLFFNINGPSGGMYSWIMGPTTWAAMDNRPGEGGHDEDWANVAEHIEVASSPAYWNGSTTLSHIASPEMDAKSVVWVFDIKNGKGPLFAELVSKIRKVYAAKRPTETYLLAWNSFSNNQGQDAVMVWPMENYAALDDQRNFGAEYDEVHGVGSWHHFLNQLDECVEGRVDWIRERID